MYMYITVYTWSVDGTWAELILSAYFFSLPKPIILLSLHAAKPFLARIVSDVHVHTCITCITYTY